MQGTPPHLQQSSRGDGHAGGMQIVDTQSLSEREFDGMALDRPFLDLLGLIEPAFQILIWGGEGSGKSTLAMGLARALLPFARKQSSKVLYVSSEEGPHMTVSMRAERMGALHPDLLISDFDSIDALKDAIRDNDIAFLIVDSVTVVDPTTAEARGFLRWCRRRGVGVALIAQALKDGSSFKGNRRLGHDVGAVVHCYQSDDGTCMAGAEKNRYSPLNTVEVPMTRQAIEPVRGEEQLDAVRTNPDCTITPQSAQCKAIFASLDEDGDRTRTRKTKTASKPSAPKPSAPKPKTSSASESKKKSKDGSGKSKSDKAKADSILIKMEQRLSEILS